MSGFAERIVGLQLGAYTVRRLIARGGMGIVYEGFQPSLDRVVAIKVLYPHLSDDPTFVERFQREARAVAQLNHPHIVRMIDYGSDQGYHFMVMDFVDGGSLRQALTDEQGQHHRMPMPQAMGVLTQISSALAWAHRRGYVHRDVKPGNILLDEDGDARLSDFGLVKMLDASNMTMTGGIVGTPEYMAPEQSDVTRTVGPAADQYALAVVAYELLTGRVPFKAPTPAATIHKHVYETPPAPRSFEPSLAPEVDAVLMRALSKDPDQRFPNIDEFSRALSASVAGRSAGSLAAGTLDASEPDSAVTSIDLSSPSVATDPAPQQESASDLVRVSAAGLGQTTGTTDASVGPPLVAPPPSRKPVAAIAAAGVAVLALAALVAWFGFLSGNDDDGDPAATATAILGAVGAPTQTPNAEPTATLHSEPTSTPTIEPSATAPATETSVATPTAALEGTATAVVVSRPIAPTATVQRITVDDRSSIIVQQTFDDGDEGRFFIGETDLGNIGEVVDGQYSLTVVNQGWQSITNDLTVDLADGIIVANVQLQGDGAVGLSARSRNYDDGTFALYVCWLTSASKAGCSVNAGGTWTELFSADVPGIVSTDTHALAMAIQGDVIVFQIDDTVVGDGTADAGITASGYWGFYVEGSTGEVRGLFDSVIIARPGE